MRNPQGYPRLNIIVSTKIFYGLLCRTHKASPPISSKSFFHFYGHTQDIFPTVSPLPYHSNTRNEACEPEPSFFHGYLVDNLSVNYSWDYSTSLIIFLITSPTFGVGIGYEGTFSISFTRLRKFSACFPVRTGVALIGVSIVSIHSVQAQRRQAICNTFYCLPDMVWRLIVRDCA